MAACTLAIIDLIRPASACIGLRYSNVWPAWLRARRKRLTNGFSKKIENLEHAVSLHFMHYNFARIHKTLRVTPAMAAGVSDHVWSLEEIAQLAG